MKILVAIASYGTTNDPYLRQLIEEYSRMCYQVDVVVVSNIPKNLAANVEVLVGLPAKNPWTLPFAHKRIFAERLDRYDLFIYSEDDTLISEKHIEAFLGATQVLKENEVAGFLRSEQGPDGTVYFSTIHRHYHWDPNSVCRRGDDTFAFFTNEHGACYILTQDQLRRAIASGGFLVPPHEGKYDLLVSAATDPYTQCGFKKLVCVSRLQDFTCKHLTNKYIGRTGLEKSQVELQVQALLDLGKNGTPVRTPVPVETKLNGTRWTKFYYEPCRSDMLRLVPSNAKRVLSLGCGWGKTEEVLVKNGVHVTAVPLDEVIGTLAAARGVEVLAEDLQSAPLRLAREKFDVLLISNLLHLLEDPTELLRRYRELLAEGGTVVVSFPNLKHLATRIRRVKGQPDLQGLGDYLQSGVHQTSERLVRNWLRSAGFRVEQSEGVIVGRWQKFDRLTLGLAKSFWAEEFIIAAQKQGHRN